MEPIGQLQQPLTRLDQPAVDHVLEGLPQRLVVIGVLFLPVIPALTLHVFGPRVLLLLLLFGLRDGYLLRVIGDLGLVPRGLRRRRRAVVPRRGAVDGRLGLVGRGGRVRVRGGRRRVRVVICLRLLLLGQAQVS